MTGDTQHSTFNIQHSTFRYRAQQFFAAIRAEVSAEERALVTRTLTAGEQRLFERMPTYDQRHCLDVYATLVDAGHSDPLLLRAAIVHDCGKVDDDGRPMGLGWYIVATLLKRLPALYLALAKSGRGPLRPIRIYAEHAWRGARMAAEAGSPPAIVDTLRHYHDPAPTGMAAILQWADEQH
ncbi:hypothetical protein EKD04_007390 [Chloroflexales bacterium ZM16-3]|nr:hypothetical protein [Chloroflexales bacterium ZM16-3]